jgi:hypothetical protein
MCKRAKVQCAILYIQYKRKTQKNFVQKLLTQLIIFTYTYAKNLLNFVKFVNSDELADLYIYIYISIHIYFYICHKTVIFTP